MTTPSNDLAAALADTAAALSRHHTLEETLDAIVNATRASVPGFTDVGISVVHQNGLIETVSGTGPLVWDLDGVQYGLREGPCVDSMEVGTTVVVEDVRHDQRWPRYVPEAVRLGLRSQLALCLYDDGTTLGGLNLYSTSTSGIGSDAVHAAELFARHAAIALGHAQKRHHLNEALTSRKTIGQAIGIVMERYEIDQDRAFMFLVRASSTSNVKLRDVAQEVLDTTDARFRRS